MKHQNLAEYCCWPCPSLYKNIVFIFCFQPCLKLCPTGFLNITRSLVCSVYIMQSCQYGPTSLRNVLSTILHFSNFKKYEKHKFYSLLWDFSQLSCNIYTHEDILFIPIWNALVDSFYYKNPRICAKAPHGTITGTEMMSTEDDRENESSVNY